MTKKKGPVGQDKIRAAANRLGVDQSRVQIIRLELGELLNEGVLIDVNVSGMSIFHRSATWEELGIPANGDDPRFRQFTRGQKFVYPEEFVRRGRSIETRMRQLFDEYTSRVRMFGGWGYLHYKRYPVFVDKWNDLLEQFNTWKAEAVAIHDSVVDEIALASAEVARVAWTSIKSQYAGVRDSEFHVIVKGKAYDHEEFVSFVVTRAIGQVPTIEQIEHDVSADYVVGLFFGQEDVAADFAQAQTRRAEVEHLRAESAQAQEQARHNQQMNILAERERQLVIEAMRQAEIEHARRIVDEVGSPIAGMIQDLRVRFAADARAMLESLEKNKFLKGKVAERGRNLLEIYRVFSVRDDRVLFDELAALHNQIGVGGESAAERDNESIRATLARIVELAEVAQGEILSTDSRFSLVEA